ncbi:MAG: 16S rRNA (adenine(1518)-N(6)/adenine(1519)-N(6))-dimethyltransferase RsmA [Acidobacteria bacterium]|nr:16S rRNA (adenine(1518)-N(6)/adenine(1519)-N(6))-dimethyltransferase RsmA [Acidobacteriota bacterium]MCI0623106.1 16S rRNA (adenine(1518)-N(6)/adenine(1519)-N(6))-dimethyltransferase RsmA [Acidobacteriota bacterium]MCI0720829.1 16S rRNA (adenine(1518)-N(6)/adenine(1519)-N(6))-dimethyltransferase RsmA [Acidobacteriota bacterium]
MSRQEIVAKKGLGQNFLNDMTMIRRIAAHLELDAEDVVLEIGCGTGALTQLLAPKTRQFIGVELDRNLFQKLEDHYSGPSVLFLNQDILKLELAELMRELQLFPAKLKVVGNLPYYISSPIIEWLGQQAGRIESATIMLQAEVAQRLLASPGTKEFGVLTLITGYHFACTKLMDVRPGAFRPMPKVHSTVLRLEPKTLRLLDLDQESVFFSFIKQAFAQRRKTLWNCLRAAVDKERLEAILNQLGRPPNCRAEVLSLEDFVALFKQLRTG